MPRAEGLYDPRFEHDSCGVGFVVNIKGKRSHELVRQAFEVSVNLLHRGACGCEVNTGDGAGMLLQLPHRFFRKAAPAAGFELPEPGGYGVGMVFLPRDAAERRQVEETFGRVVVEEGQRLLGWRDVPTDSGHLGATARSGEPVIRQIFIGRGPAPDDAADAAARFERKLYVIRNRAAHEADRLQLRERELFYVASLSSNTIVYKGMLIADQVERITNTFPSWPLAHPYRYCAHNGEINTLRGNINWMRAREALCRSDLFGDDLQKAVSVDSRRPERYRDVRQRAGVPGPDRPPLAHAVLMMIPEPWSNHESMSPERKAFYEYHASLMEPWDGPASIAFTDGTVIGAVLDRNGLRPSRYYVTKDDMVIMASEGRIVDDEEIKRDLARERSYAAWLKQELVHIDDLPPAPGAPAEPQEAVRTLQRAFGYTEEDLRILIAPMAQNGAEPIGSMGTDTALAVLSDRSRLLYDYFKQLFAQVTNPPLDAIREELVTDMGSTLGAEANLLAPDARSCHHVKVDAPLITNDDLAKLRRLHDPAFRNSDCRCSFDPARAGAKRQEMDETVAGGQRRVALGGGDACDRLVRDAGSIASTRRCRPCWPRPASTTTSCEKAPERAAR
ncbi:Ferredoxin-dependent glutamate synthase 1 [Geodia barretti]|uniref:glutamate synthase (ferredoxin) n=1 Tax=Geodia barretti TaxID=519541 RepID=A0AA35WCH0_GEOBA|nr:Ferredoxin-dependent glutamate synthase 1 [Geodia barretti]